MCEQQREKITQDNCISNDHAGPTEQVPFISQGNDKTTLARTNLKAWQIDAPNSPSALRVNHLLDGLAHAAIEQSELEQAEQRERGRAAEQHVGRRANHAKLARVHVVHQHLLHAHVAVRNEGEDCKRAGGTDGREWEAQSGMSR